MRGRPTKLNEALATVICERISAGESLRSVCRDKEMPNRRTVLRWAEDNEVFRGQYARARDALVDHWAEEIIEIADDGSNDTYERDGRQVVNNEVVQRSRLRVDTRKWLMSRMAPKKYGDKVTNEHTGEGGGAMKMIVEVVRK